MIHLLLGCERGIPEERGQTADCCAMSPAPAPEAREDDFLYGNEILDLSLTLDDDAIAGLARWADEEVGDVRATLRWEDEVHELGLRLRGGEGSFRPFDGKPGFRLDFGAFEPDARFHSVRHLLLKNMVQDTSMLAEHAALRLFAEQGVAAPRHGYARVSVNGELYGLYAVVEAVDSAEFVARSFPDAGGPLLEGQMDDFVSSGIDDYDVVLDGSLADPRAPVRRFVGALDAADPATLLEVLDARTDAMLGLMAVELVTGNPDGYVAWTNNYYLYVPPGSGRIHTIAWGPDQAFTEPLDVATTAHPARLYRDCRAASACSAALDARIAAVADRLASPDWLGWLDGEAVRTEADCADDPRSPGGEAACHAAREELIDFLGRRPAEVLADLD